MNYKSRTYNKEMTAVEFDPSNLTVVYFDDPLNKDHYEIDICNYSPLTSPPASPNRSPIKRPLLVLDIDETLVRSVKEPIPGLTEDLFICDLYVYRRPFLEYFLRAIAVTYDIAIWSAGGEEYVKKVVDYIIPKTILLQFVYSKSECVYALINNSRQLIKPLSKLKIFGYESTNILILDDNGDLTTENHRNCLIPTKYLGQQCDCELVDVLRYLEYIAYCRDFTDLPHRNWRVIVTSLLNSSTDIDIDLNEFCQV